MAILDEVLQTLEIQPTGIPTVVRLSQNENGRQIRLTLRGNESNFPAGCLVTISGTKPDGVVYSASGELDGNVAVINEDTQMTAVSGMWKARVNVTYGGSTIATELIVFEVYADPVDPGSVPSESELNGLVAEAQYWAENARSSAYGSPLVAETVAEMIETDRVYVYTGSETGYTAGHWYYYDGSAWADGGIYNAAAVQTDTTLSVPGMAADAKATGDAIAAEADRVDTLLESKADKNGNYHDMTAGTAEVVLSEVYDTDKTPYKFRRTPYKSRRLSDMIVGGSVAWNQWMPISSTPTATSDGVTFTNNADGSWTLTGTPSGNNAFRNLNYTSGQNNCHLTANHVYYMPKGNTSTLAVGVRLYNTNGDPSVMTADAASKIFKVNSVGTQSYTRLQVSYLTNTNIGTITVKPMLFDLTQMFGSTIADYIYSIETATEGAGVSLFRSLFPADYYAYNTGEIKSVSGLSAHKMRDADNNVIGNYALDSSLTLRGVPKLDSNNKLYYDGDIYAPDGTVTRRYGVRAYQSGDESLTDAITDGTNTVYKLTTATTETAQPYHEIQICNPDGTEEYVSTGIVPVGHESKYYRDLDAVIPAAPTADGVYTLKCTVTDGVPSYSWEV